MKNFILFTMLLTFSFQWQGKAQTLNQPANWPNTNWVLDTIAHTGSHAMDIEANPTIDATFAYDDDDTGSNSHDVIAAESPIIDLTAAHNAGENFIKVSGDYVYYNVNSSEYLAIEYWDADASAWTLWYRFPSQDTQGAPRDNYCSGTHQDYITTILDISQFSPTQLSGFKYRLIYNDNTSGDTAWMYGFCFSSPTIYSVSTDVNQPQFTLDVNPDCDNSQFYVAVDVTDLGGSNSVTISDDQGSSTQQISDTTTVNFGPYPSGTSVTITVTSDDDPHYSSSDSEQYVCPPPNDTCDNAISLTVYPEGGGTGNELNQSTSTATASNMNQTSCDSYGTNLDLFYSFTAPNNGAVKVITGGDKGENIEAAVYDSCGGNELYCFGESTEKTITDLTPGQTYILQVWHDDYHKGDFTIVLEEITCPDPSDLQVLQLTNNSAVLAWADHTNGSASYYLSYKTVNDSLWTTTITNAGDTSVAISNLTPNTEYQWKIQEDCGSGNSSPEISGTNFITFCQSDTPPYSETFDNFPPSCWYEAKGPVSGPTKYSGYVSWTSDDFANDNANSSSARINLYNTSHHDWLISPVFDFSSGSFNVAFDVAATNHWNTDATPMGSDDQVQFLISTDGGATWTSLETWDTNNVPSNTGDYKWYDLSTTTSPNVVFAFWASDGTINDSEDWDFFVDNFHIVGSLPVSELGKDIFSFYPNPTQGTIRWTATETPSHLSIVNISGQVLYEANKPESNLIDIGKLPAGVYMLHVTIGDRQGTFRLIKE